MSHAESVEGGIARVVLDDGSQAWVVRSGGVDLLLEDGLRDLLTLPVEESRRRIEAAMRAVRRVETGPPVDAQEVWAAGVTYRRSRDERMAESTSPSIYDRVYDAERPEIFFKATADRVVGFGEPVGIRADSEWNVPEPELGLVFTSRGELFGFVPGNDMSSRSIEGENPLYLPQAKVYDASCALGPAIVPAWSTTGPHEIRLEIERDGGIAFADTTSTELITRSADELSTWLFRAMSFPHGVVLLTGTGIVPPESFTLNVGDVIRIRVEGVGTLENPVREVGGGVRAESPREN